MSTRIVPSLQPELVDVARLAPGRLYEHKEVAETIAVQTYSLIAGLMIGMRSRGAGGVVWTGPNGRNIVFEHNQPLTYEEAKRLLGMTEVDLIQEVYASVEGVPVRILMDEEGKLKSLPANLVATWMYQGLSFTLNDLPDVIVGEALVLFGPAIWE